MSENETKKEDFKGSGVFGDLPKEKWEEISRALEKLTVAPRSIIFRQGDPGDCFYIITSGKVRVSGRIATAGDAVVRAGCRGELRGNGVAHGRGEISECGDPGRDGFHGALQRAV